MQKTKETYDIVLRLGKQVFLIFKDIYVLYDPESTWWVDDRIECIEEEIYPGDLIMNHDGMVLKHNDAVERLITEYFGVDPDIITYALVNQNYDNGDREISTYNIYNRYELTKGSWQYDTGKCVDTKVIYQGDGIPIKIPDVSEVEIYDEYYGIFGIHSYERWIPCQSIYHTGEIYHMHGEFIADSQYDKLTKTVEVKVFTPTTHTDPTLPEKILVTKKGFVDDKTFNCVGNEPVELDIFFRFDQLDTDSWYMTVLLITAPMDSYLHKKEHSHLPGDMSGAYNSHAKISFSDVIPKRWTVENVRTKKKTEYAIGEATTFKSNTEPEEDLRFHNVLTDEETEEINTLIDKIISNHSESMDEVVLSIEDTLDKLLDGRYQK